MRLVLALLLSISVLAGCERTPSGIDPQSITWPGYERADAGDVAFVDIDGTETVVDAALRDHVLDVVWSLELDSSVVTDGLMETMDTPAIWIDIEPRGRLRLVERGMGVAGEGRWTARRTGTGVAIGNSMGDWYGTFRPRDEERLDVLWRKIIDAIRDTDSSTEHE